MFTWSSSFVSGFWKELFKLQDSQLKMSTAYHSQKDGQTEIINHYLETFLCCFIAYQPKLWVLWVPQAEYQYDTTFHVSTGTTPFEAVYDRQPPMLTCFLIGKTKVEVVQLELIDRDEALQQLQHHLLRAHSRMKSQADRKRTNHSFEVRDWVFLKLRSHAQQTVMTRICPKLAPHYYGPFQIVERIGMVAYKVQLPESTQIHPVFHVS